VIPDEPWKKRFLKTLLPWHQQTTRWELLTQMIFSMFMIQHSNAGASTATMYSQPGHRKKP